MNVRQRLEKDQSRQVHSTKRIEARQRVRPAGFDGNVDVTLAENKSDSMSPCLHVDNTHVHVHTHDACAYMQIETRAAVHPSREVLFDPSPLYDLCSPINVINVDVIRQHHTIFPPDRIRYLRVGAGWSNDAR